MTGLASCPSKMHLLFPSEQNLRLVGGAKVPPKKLPFSNFSCGSEWPCNLILVNEISWNLLEGFVGKALEAGRLRWHLSLCSPKRTWGKDLDTGGLLEMWKQETDGGESGKGKREMQVKEALMSQLPVGASARLGTLRSCVEHDSRLPHQRTRRLGLLFSIGLDPSRVVNCPTLTSCSYRWSSVAPSKQRDSVVWLVCDASPVHGTMYTGDYVQLTEMRDQGNVARAP